MKTSFSILLLITICTFSFAQDGSDIKYFKVQGIDISLIGKDVHFDFYRLSFGGKDIDTVSINIGNKPIKFIEIRTDNGYNNWFSRQYLQSIEKINGETVRISKLRIDSISQTSFIVTMFIDFYDSQNKLLLNKSNQQKYSFEKHLITEVLVKSKQY
jgi:hypothetical protein